MASDRGTAHNGVAPSPFGSISLWLLLFALWLIMNASIELPVVLTGAVIALVIDWIFMRRSGTWWQVILTPKSVVHFIAYTGVFFVELVKANLNMLRYVYSPRIDIHPGIVKINTGSNRR